MRIHRIRPATATPVCAATTSAAVETGELGHLVEVGAVVHHVDDDVGAAVAGASTSSTATGVDAELAEPLPGRCLMARPGELDQHRARGGHDVDDAGQVGLPQCGGPRQHLGGAVELEQQRLIAVVGTSRSIRSVATLMYQRTRE